MKTRNAMTALAALGLATLTILAPTPAQASIPAGVEGCTAVSQGDYFAGQCQTVVAGGYYYLTVDSSSWAQVEVGCTPSGGGGPVDNAGGGFAYTYFYLPAGACTVLVYGADSSIGELFKV
jgi:hypothetical protein